MNVPMCIQVHVTRYLSTASCAEHSFAVSSLCLYFVGRWKCSALFSGCRMQIYVDNFQDQK